MECLKIGNLVDFSDFICQELNSAGKVRTFKMLHLETVRYETDPKNPYFKYFGGDVPEPPVGV